MSHRGLTPEVVDQLEAALVSGQTITTACAAAEISTRTFHRWRQRGTVELMRLDADDEAEPLDSEAEFVDFVTRLDAARARAAIEVTTTLRALATAGIERTKTVVGACSAEGCRGAFTTTTTETVIDAASVRWLAERLEKGDYHLAQRIEIAQAPDEELADRLGPLATELMRAFVGELKTAVTPKQAEKLEAKFPAAYARAWAAVSERHGRGPRAIEQEPGRIGGRAHP